MTGPEKLSRHLAEGQPIRAVGAFDAVSGKLIEQAGFEAVHIGGSVTAASRLGLPDIGMLELRDLESQVRTVSEGSDLPIIVDADTGFGNELQVYRSVERLIGAGAAAIHLEDQVAPKRCGHLAGKEVVPVEVMLSKLAAACAARGDSPVKIIARTDARAVTGLDDALERIARYAEAGVDGLFVDFPETRNELEEVARRGADLGVPMVFNAARVGDPHPLMTAHDAIAVGYQIILFPIEAYAIALASLRDGLRALRICGTARLLPADPLSFAELNDLVGLGGWLDRSNEFEQRPSERWRQVDDGEKQQEG